MPVVYFYKLGEHNATIRGADTKIWHIRLEHNNEEYYIEGKRVHTTMQNGRYWTDDRHLLTIRQSQKSTFGGLEQKEVQMKPSNEPIVYQQVQCGHCNHVNLVNIEFPQQGSHKCARCNGTICVIKGKHLKLQFGARALQTVLR